LRWQSLGRTEHLPNRAASGEDTEYGESKSASMKHDCLQQICDEYGVKKKKKQGIKPRAARAVSEERSLLVGRVEGNRAGAAPVPNPPTLWHPEMLRTPVLLPAVLHTFSRNKEERFFSS